MNEALFMVALYIIPGIICMSVIWFQSGSDLRVSDVFFILLMASVWPIFFGVIAAKEFSNRKLFEAVIWKRKRKENP